MPSENDKILACMVSGTSRGTETQRILSAYQTALLREFSPDREGSPITPGSAVYDRAAVGAQKFITGHGGGISQMVGGAAGFLVGAKNMAAAANKFKTEETANWLYTKLIPILKRHDNQLTVAQLEDTLRRIPITKGGPNIDPDQITVLRGYQNKQQIIDEDNLKHLLEQIASQLQEIALTGKAARMNYGEFFKHMDDHFDEKTLAGVLAQFTVGGQVTMSSTEGTDDAGDPKEVSGAVEDIPVILPPAGFESEPSAEESHDTATPATDDIEDDMAEREPSELAKPFDPSEMKPFS